MKITRTVVLKIIICALVIINCTNNSSLESENLFMEMYGNCEMNTLLKMDFVGKLYENDNDVNFSLEPMSNISVIFPAGYNIRLLYFDSTQGKWVGIKNNVRYLPADAKYVIGKNDPAKEYAYLLIGVIPALGKQEYLRIVLHGHTYENGVETDRCVGAFLDFEFSP